MSLASGTVLLRPFQRNDIDRQREYFKDPELPWLDSNSPRGYAEIDLEELMDTDAAKERHVVALGIEVDGQYVGFCRLLHTANPNGVFEPTNPSVKCPAGGFTHKEMAKHSH